MLNSAEAPALELDVALKDCRVQADVTSVRTYLLLSFKQLRACRGQNDLLDTFLWIILVSVSSYHSGWLQLINVFWAV